MTEPPRPVRLALPVPTQVYMPREVTADRASLLAWRRFHAPPRGWVVERSSVKQLGGEYDNTCGWCGRVIGESAHWISHDGTERKMFACEECSIALVTPVEGSTYTESDRSDALERARYAAPDRCRRVNKRLAMHERSNWKHLGGPAYRYFPPEWDHAETMCVFWHDDKPQWFWKALLPDGTIDEMGPFGTLIAASERFISYLLHEEKLAGQL